MAFHHPAPTAPFLRGIVLALTLAVLPARADSLPRPSGASFAHGAVLTVAGYDAARPALEGFPVLVRISAGSPSGFAYSQLQSPSTGADLVFLDMEGNGLPFEIDTWNPSGESLVWVRLPAMRNGARFAMCWGSSTSGKAVCADNPWDDYVGVWHMNEDAAGITTIHDSTTNALDGTTVTSSSSKTDGKVGRARFITSNKSNTAGNPYDSGVTVDMTGNAAKLAVVDDLVPEFTASFWIRPQDNANWWYFITRKASDVGPGWGLQQGASGDFTKYRAYGGVETDSNCKSFSGVSGLSQGVWTKVDAVWKANKTFVLYMNGTQVASGTLVNQASNGNQTKLALGGAMAPTDTTKKNGRGVYGDMDEIRLRKGALSADWIAADHATQFDSAFLTVGAAEEIDVAAPAATLSVTGESFTGAVARVRVFALGEGADSATARVEVSATQDFAVTVWSGEAEVAAAGTVDIAATGLAFGTDYWARGIMTNAIGGAVALGPVTFSTPSPGAPEGVAEFVERGFTTLSALGVATSYGEGGTSATMRLEASTDASFATLAGTSEEVPALLREAVTLAVPDLTPGVEYRLRFRFVNDWGRETFIVLPEAVMTLDGPFDATGITWAFAPDFTKVGVSLEVTAVFGGATGTAILYCDEDDEPTTPCGERTVSVPGALEWPDLPFDGDALHAKVIVTSEVDGSVYTQAWTAVVDHSFKRLRPVKLEGVTADVNLTDTGISEPWRVFDGSYSTGVAAKRNKSVVGDVSAMLTEEEMENNEVYVSRLEVTHEGDSSYSLYTSEDGETWKLVPGATNVTYAGTASYPVSAVARYVKCTFESSWNESKECLYEIEAWGFVKAKAKVVSNTSNASMCAADGSGMTSNGQGGWNSWWGRLFDGNLTNYQMWPKADPGGYALVDFTRNDGSANALKEYFVTELKVSSTGTKRFTLQYSVDGNTWIDVDGAVNVSYEGVATFAVAKTAKKVRYVFVDGSWNDFSDQYLAEFQVWGIDPSDAPCDHPSYSEWVVGAVPATCTERAMDSRICTVCGERFTKLSDEPPLGHDYVTTLTSPGRYSSRKDQPDHRRYGDGSIECARCGFRLDFPMALDLVTNKVDGVLISGMKTEGVVRFTDVSVSSENHPEWGPGGKKIIDGVWNTSQEWPYWTTTSQNGQYADFEFGTTIDLTTVEFSVYNHAYDFEFCRIDDDTGTETAFLSFSIAKDETETDMKSETVTAIDPSTGKECEVEIWKKVDLANDYQRIRVPFFETPVRHLRVRVTDGQPIDLWSCKGLRVIEIHPWGTVCGAGDIHYPKESLMILR